MKKYSMLFLILLIIVQIAIPLGMIINKYAILNTGDEVKFEVRPVDPYDPYRGRYVAINVNQERLQNKENWENGEYGIVKINDNGFAEVISTTKDRPKEGLYIKSSNKNYFRMPIDRYYMDEKLAPIAERITWNLNGIDKIYITVRIKDGDAVISGLYVNDMKIEDYVLNKMNE